MKGNIEILITMADNTIKPQEINSQPQAWMPATPIVDWIGYKGEIRNYSPEYLTDSPSTARSSTR